MVGLNRSRMCFQSEILSFLLSSIFFVLYISSVRGHGMIMDPPGRSSMWRVGWNTPINYDDNALNCGGYSTQWDTYSGKCGECGDNYGLPRPRPNEAGGEYGTGIITANYTKGSVLHASIDITANHNGYFEFFLCPNNNPQQYVNQSCFDQHLLKLSDGSTKYYLPSSQPMWFYVDIQLPVDITCYQCVLQWKYTAGNNWGTCVNGTSGVGCGPQETFINCADIGIY